MDQYYRYLPFPLPATRTHPPHSERNPVPTTQKYESEKQAREKAEEASQQNGSPKSPQPPGSPASPRNTQGKDEKSEMMNKMAGPKGKPTDKVKERKGERTVKDPTTGLDVVIRDANFKGEHAL
jgi:hypothetical protein